VKDQQLKNPTVGDLIQVLKTFPRRTRVLIWDFGEADLVPPDHIDYHKDTNALAIEFLGGVEDE